MDKSHFSFEQLCIRNEKGYSFDLGTMLMPSDPNTFDDVVFKLISKIDTSLLLLNTHDVQVENFTIIAVPLPSQEISDQVQHEAKSYSGRKSKTPSSRSVTLNLTTLQNAWNYLAEEGWHGLQSLALLTPDSLPNTGARQYSLYQYTTCIMDVIRANYMFQKFKINFHHETLEMFDEADIKDGTQAVFGLLWKKSLTTQKERRIPMLTPVKRKSSVLNISESKSSPVKKIVSPIPLLSPRMSKRQTQKENGQGQMSFTLFTGSEEEEIEEEEEEEEEMEVDEEISFKNPLKQYRLLKMEPEEKPQSPPAPKGRRRTLKREPSPTLEPSPPSLPAGADIPLGFETSAIVASKGRKSMAARKSLSSDWPEDERENILKVFDNLNPSVSEQKRIALTLKYVSLVLEKELPSKLLYQWIQKKGRVVNRTTTTFTALEGDEQKEVALQWFRELNGNCSETARIAVTLKFLDVQYGLSVTSKQLYTWLNEKPAVKKTAKRR